MFATLRTSARCRKAYVIYLAAFDAQASTLDSVALAAYDQIPRVSAAESRAVYNALPRRMGQVSGLPGG